MLLRTTSLALALALATACDEPAEAASAPEERRAAEFRSERVAAALDVADARVRTRGFTADSDEDFRGFLTERASTTDEAPMRSGNCYVVLGAGTPALRELDLRIFDSDGAEVAHDANTGRVAAAQYCPAQSGMYYLAAQATAGAGLFAVRRFRGPTGLDVRLDDLFGELPTPDPQAGERP